MQIQIGEYDITSRDVPVTFTLGDIVHERRVNACHDKSGEYDPVATSKRVAQVALGVAAKIDAGIIVAMSEDGAASPDREAAVAG